MHTYTQQEFDALPLVGEHKQCPTGDYSQLKVFGGHCSFGEACSFSKCSFFGKLCSFGKLCYFGVACAFGEYCSFGERCSFGEYCSFGEACSFGKACAFGKACTFEGHKKKAGYPFLSLSGAGTKKRTTYFFNFKDGIYVRSGCFFGTLTEFRTKVIADCPQPTDIKRLQYLGFANIAAATFAQPDQVQ
jgi:hypothetical protein